MAHRVPVLTVEKAATDCLDILDLKRRGLLRNRASPVVQGFRWPRIAALQADRNWIQLRMSGGASTQRIRVTWTLCNFGGERPWLHCPHCQSKRQRLFRGMGGYFCLVCIGNIPYASQTKSRESRAHYAATKLRLRIGTDAGLSGGQPARPKGMHRRTYRRVLQKLAGLEHNMTQRLRLKAPDYQNLAYHID